MWLQDQFCVRTTHSAHKHSHSHNTDKNTTQNKFKQHLWVQTFDIWIWLLNVSGECSSNKLFTSVHTQNTKIYYETRAKLQYCGLREFLHKIQSSNMHCVRDCCIFTFFYIKSPSGLSSFTVVNDFLGDCIHQTNLADMGKTRFLLQKNSLSF